MIGEEHSRAQVVGKHVVGRIGIRGELQPGRVLDLPIQVGREGHPSDVAAEQPVAGRVRRTKHSDLHVLSRRAAKVVIVKGREDSSCTLFDRYKPPGSGPNRMLIERQGRVGKRKCVQTCRAQAGCHLAQTQGQFAGIEARIESAIATAELIARE